MILLASPVDRIFRQIIDWVQSVLGKKKKTYQPQKILLERTSSITRLLLIERDTPRAVRTWRSIPKTADHDILITCDHLFKLPGEKTPPEKQNPHATHRLSVMKISRVLGANGSRRIVLLWSGDFNMVASGADQHRYAIVITDALAKQLLGISDEEIVWDWEAQSYIKQYVGSVARPSA